MLTDGEVDHSWEVKHLAQKNEDRVKIHTFGVGTDCSRDLIVEVAKLGRGSASFVDEYSDDLKGLVITALKKACEPSYHDCSFKMIDNWYHRGLESPNNGWAGEAFRNFPVNYYFTIKES